MSDTVTLSWPKYQSGRRVSVNDLPRAFYRRLFFYMAEGAALRLDSTTDGTNNMRGVLVRALVTYPTEFRNAAATGYRARAERLAREQRLSARKAERDPVFRAYNSIADDVQDGVDGVQVDFGLEGDLVLPERGFERAMYPLK